MSIRPIDSDAPQRIDTPATPERVEPSAASQAAGEAAHQAKASGPPQAQNGDSGRGSIINDMV